jgi:hypothetical protein
MMKFFVFSAFALLVGAKAHAVGCGNMITNIPGCFANATTSSGTGRTCDQNATGCLCTDAGGDALYTTCPWGWSGVALALNGKTCCRNDMAAPEMQPTVQSSESSDISEAFEPKTAVYFGYLNSTSRSPTAGRAQSIHARLDICLGANDTDSAIATMNANTCYNSYCGSAYNEYCQASGTDGGWSGAYAVCHDRCECAINGVGDSSCNQL